MVLRVLKVLLLHLDLVLFVDCVYLHLIVSLRLLDLKEVLHARFLLLRLQQLSHRLLDALIHLLLNDLRLLLVHG